MADGFIKTKKINVDDRATGDFDVDVDLGGSQRIDMPILLVLEKFVVFRTLFPTLNIGFTFMAC